MNKIARTPWRDLPAPQRAAILGNTPYFQAFVAAQCGMQGEMFSPEACAEWLRRQCGVQSRRDLAALSPARNRFEAIETEFAAFAGRIPQQR